MVLLFLAKSRETCLNFVSIDDRTSESYNHNC
jgi:hypothetical protein